MKESMRFLEGPAGTGKTTTAIEHLLALLRNGVNPQHVLVLVPQRNLGRPYQLALANYGTTVDIVTIGGLAVRAVDIFWPLIAADAGFINAGGHEPTFLTIETAQYHMARFVDESLQAGRFDGVNVQRARLIAQSLDNLSKAAVNGFSIEEITARLTSAWAGHSSRHMVYRSWQEVAQQFRSHCLENNLLDFSLQIEVFAHHILHNKQAAMRLREQYTYLIADNIEENSPVALDFIRWLWPSLEDALLIYDTQAGYRIFLGAEPDGAYGLHTLCDEHVISSDSYVQSSPVQALEAAVMRVFGETASVKDKPVYGFTYQFHTFYPQMLDWVCQQVTDLIFYQNVEPRNIVLIAPFLNDSLRFSVMNYLESAGVPVVSHRPSRAIREEPVTRAMLTMMQLVNPLEDRLPPVADVADALVQFIDGLDPIRASLLTDIVYGIGRREWGAFEIINATMQERITYVIGERYDRIRKWLQEESEKVSQTPPDYFLRSFFGDVVSQPGYALHTNPEAGTVVAQLVDSAFSFRTALYPDGTEDWSPVWKDYRELVSEGLLAAFHPLSWQKEESNAVFIAPAYTYLMRNRPVDYQFWIDVGSQAWGERLEQPLTHPYVLRRDYPIDQIWTDEDEIRTNRETLFKLVLGLMRRCRRQVYLAIADLGEQGFEQRGPLLYLFQQVLRREDKS